MPLMEIQTILPYPIENVFALTVDLEKAPHWHHIFSDIQKLTTHPIGLGSRWKINYGIGNLVVEIIDYQAPQYVVFKGSTIPGGIIPNFTINLQTVAVGTQIQYVIDPKIPFLLNPLMTIIVPPYGRWDLTRYFRELEQRLAVTSDEVR